MGRHDSPVRHLLLMAALFLTFSMVSHGAFAGPAAGNSIASILCSVKNMFTGGIGILLAVVAVCILGLTAALGRINWPTALTTVVGIAIVFGADNLLILFRPTTGGVVAACPPAVAALEAEGLTEVFCTIYTLLQGAVGASLATIAVCILGIGAMLGKVQWQTALVVTIGIIILFSADSAVHLLYGGTTGTLGGLPGNFVTLRCGSATMSFGVFTQSMCMIAAYISGQKGIIMAVIATLCVQILALAAMFGRVSWSLAMMVAVGIGLIFGSFTIVGYMSQRNVACQVFDKTYNLSATKK